MSGLSAPGGPITNLQIDAQSDDETLGQWIDVRGCQSLTFYCASTGTTSGGVISFEEQMPLVPTYQGVQTPFPGATGTFSVITTVNASTFSGDTQVAVHLPSGAYGYVRARISTAISGGGTASVSLVAY